MSEPFRTTRRRRRRPAPGVAPVVLLGALVAVLLLGALGVGLLPIAGNGDLAPASAEPAEVTHEPVTCAQGWPAFDPALLTERPPLDTASELGRAVRDDPPGSFGPIEGWTLAGRSGPTAYTLAWLANGGILAVTYQQSDDGSWSIVRNLHCVPQRAYDDGLEPAEWTLAGSPPGPDATSVTILVTETGCASGASPADRLADPIVEYRDDAVLITPRLEPLAAETGTCRSGPAAPLTVRLDQPLGDRQLLDGRWHPARPALPAPGIRV